MQRKFSWFFLSRFQKESFCLPKRVLLHSKRSPFALQNESFCSPKRVLLHTKRSPFEMPSDFALITTVPMALCISGYTDSIISIFF